ncbi:MAG TPA: ATP-grasp domain-containing protein [Pirellulales bacterium]
MRIFVFEYLTGGGLLANEGASVDAASLLAEGAVMVTALAADFARLPQTHVTVLRDQRATLPVTANVHFRPVAAKEEFDTTLIDESAAADWTVVIAPECDGILVSCLERVIAAGGRLLGPGIELARLASDKQATAEHLVRHGVPVPVGCLLADYVMGDLAFPLVLKPRDGAGSLGVRLLKSPPVDELPATDAQRLRIEKWRPGQPASVGVLCGPMGNVALPSCTQRLSDDGHFHYLGGSLPLPPPLAERAQHLALRAINTLPQPVGYIGVDLILGPDDSGAEDVVIEINPRLTTSYVGLRAAARDNLAAAMLAVASGQSPELTFRPERIEFSASGDVRVIPNAGDSHPPATVAVPHATG